MTRNFIIKTPLIIKETLGQDVYDKFEELRETRPDPQPMIMSPKMFDAFNEALESDYKLHKQKSQ